MNRNQVFALVGGVIIVILIAIGIQARFGGSEQKVLAESLQKVVSGTPLHSTTTLDLDLPARKGGRNLLVDVTIKTEGDLSKRENELAYAGDLHIEAKGQGTIFFANGDIRILPDSTVFRLDELPSILNPTGSLLNKWTRVNTSLLKAEHKENFSTAVASLAQRVTAKEEQPMPGGTKDMLYYRGSLSPDDEEALIKTFELKESHSQALNVIARLLKGFDAKDIEIWVDKGEKEVRFVRIQFTQPGQADRTSQPRTATLAFALSDYGKQVQVETPKEDITVRPEIFARLFGEGQVTSLEAPQ